VLYWQFWASFWKSWADLVTRADSRNSTLPLPKEIEVQASAPLTVIELENIEERVRAEFFSNVNHDLRTPLNAVIGFAQIIESEMFGKIDNPQYLEYVRHIQDSGYELLAKIENLCGNAEELPEKKRAYAGTRGQPEIIKPKKHLAVVE
jgi:signal transduction histidine kinase